MNEAKVVRKINEMVVVQTAVLNAYQSMGEVSLDDELTNKFESFASNSKELLSVLNDSREALAGELIDNIEVIADDLNEAIEAAVRAGVFSANETLRHICRAYFLETFNYRNWSVLKALAEEEEDERLEEVKEAKRKVEKMRVWLKDKIDEISLEEAK